MLAGILALGSAASVCAKEPYQTRYQVSQEEREDYAVLTEDLGEYTVREGDSLWRICEKLMGDGEAYRLLAGQNADIVKNPDLIYPDMHLQINRNVYVKKRTGVNGIKTPQYRQIGRAHV